MDYILLSKVHHSGEIIGTLQEVVPIPTPTWTMYAEEQYIFRKEVELAKKGLEDKANAYRKLRLIGVISSLLFLFEILVRLLAFEVDVGLNTYIEHRMAIDGLIFPEGGKEQAYLRRVKSIPEKLGEYFNKVVNLTSLINAIRENLFQVLG